MAGVNRDRSHSGPAPLGREWLSRPFERRSSPARSCRRAISWRPDNSTAAMRREGTAEAMPHTSSTSTGFRPGALTTGATAWGGRPGDSNRAPPRSAGTGGSAIAQRSRPIAARQRDGAASGRVGCTANDPCYSCYSCYTWPLRLANCSRSSNCSPRQRKRNPIPLHVAANSRCGDAARPWATLCPADAHHLAVLCSCTTFRSVARATIRSAQAFSAASRCCRYSLWL